MCHTALTCVLHRYEETGWYDGQIWVKTPPVLLRDRLLGINSVKPTLSRLRATLVSLAGVMAGSTVLLAALPAPQAMGSAASLPETRAAMQPSSRQDYWKQVECYEYVRVWFVGWFAVFYLFIYSFVYLFIVYLLHVHCPHPVLSLPLLPQAVGSPRC